MVVLETLSPTQKKKKKRKKRKERKKNINTTKWDILRNLINTHSRTCSNSSASPYEPLPILPIKNRFQRNTPKETASGHGKDAHYCRHENIDLIIVENVQPVLHHSRRAVSQDFITPFLASFFGSRLLVPALPEPVLSTRCIHLVDNFASSSSSNSLSLDDIALVYHQCAGATFTFHNLSTPNVLDRELEEAAEDRVYDAPKEADHGQTPHEHAPASGRPERAKLITGGGGSRVLGRLAQGKGHHAGGNEDDASEQPRTKTHEGDAAICSGGNDAEDRTCDEAGLGLSKDAELGAEGVRSDGGVVADDSQRKEVTLPGITLARCYCMVDTAFVSAGTPGAELVCMDEDKYACEKGVGKDLDMGSRAFTAWGGFGRDGKFVLGVFVNLGESGLLVQSCETTDAAGDPVTY